MRYKKIFEENAVEDLKKVLKKQNHKKAKAEIFFKKTKDKLEYEGELVFKQNGFSVLSKNSLMKQPILQSLFDVNSFSFENKVLIINYDFVTLTITFI